MELIRENLPQSKVKLKVKVSSSELRAIFTNVYKKLSPQIEVKGFRQGQAPQSMIISAIGENRLQSEIIDAALQQTYPEALKKENIIPIAPPAVSITVMKDLLTDNAYLEYEAQIDVLPKVQLGDYKKIKIKLKNEKVEVTDEDIEHVISHLKRTHATFKDVDRPVESQDRIEMDFEGTEKGVKLENLSSKNYPVILGSGVLLPDFEKYLIGLKKDEEKQFSLQMQGAPEAEKAPIGKKKIDFKVKILLIQEVILPEENDVFAQKFGKKNMHDLKKAISEDVFKQKEREQGMKIENEVLTELLKLEKVEVPESLINQEIERQINDIRSRASQIGLTYEKYLEQMKKTEAEFKEALKPQAEKTIKIGLALGEIVNLESKNWQIDPKDKEAGKKVLEHLIATAIK